MISCLLEQLKGKGVLWRWGEVEQSVFENLKVAFVMVLVLIMPNIEAAFWVKTDASDFSVDTVLSQMAENGEWQPVMYFSKAMQLVEQNYNIYNKELLLVVWALEVWGLYLEGNPFPVEVFSDHWNLGFLMMAQDLNRQQAWWSLFLNWFVFII